MDKLELGIIVNSMFIIGINLNHNLTNAIFLILGQIMMNILIGIK